MRDIIILLEKLAEISEVIEIWTTLGVETGEIISVNKNVVHMQVRQKEGEHPQYKSVYIPLRQIIKIITQTF